jgi:hypothetical protein
VQSNLTRSIRKYFENYGVCCFSDQSQEMLLWAHYANGLRGFCLEFDSGILEDHFIESGVPLLRVDYTRHYLTPSLYSTDCERRTRLALATKAMCWSHEGEWRLVMPRRAAEVDLPREAIKGIILGCLVNGCEAENLIECMRQHYRHARIRWAEPSATSYSIELLDDEPPGRVSPGP